MKSTIDGLFAVGKINELISVMETDTYWINRLQAAEALAKLRDPRGWDYLNQSLNSTNLEVREGSRERNSHEVRRPKPSRRELSSHLNVKRCLMPILRTLQCFVAFGVRIVPYTASTVR